MDNLTLNGWLRRARVQPGGEALEFLLELNSPLRVDTELLNEIEVESYDVELLQYLDMHIETAGELRYQTGQARPGYWIFVARIVRRA